MPSSITLGKVSIAPKGAYAAGTSYTVLDMVSNAGGSFLCIQNSTGIEPGVTSGWENYWMSASNGIESISITSPALGKASITITLSDGSQTSTTIDTAAIGTGAVTKEMLADGATYTAYTVTLTAAGWSGNGQSVSAAGVTANNTVITGPTPASLKAYGEYGIYCSGQGAGTLSFICESAPDTDLTVNVFLPK